MVSSCTRASPYGRDATRPWTCRRPMRCLRGASPPGSAGIVIADVDTGVRFDHPDLLRAPEPGRAAVCCRATISSVEDYNPNDRRGARHLSDRQRRRRLGSRTLPIPAIGSAARIPRIALFSERYGRRRVPGTAPASSASSGRSPTTTSASPGMSWGPWMLPVRALGKGGGYDSDIIAGIEWAAGMPVTSGRTAGPRQSLSGRHHQPEPGRQRAPAPSVLPDRAARRSPARRAGGRIPRATATRPERTRRGPGQLQRDVPGVDRGRRPAQCRHQGRLQRASARRSASPLPPATASHDRARDACARSTPRPIAAATTPGAATATRTRRTRISARASRRPSCPASPR